MKDYESINNEPTPEQLAKVDELAREGYNIDLVQSITLGQIVMFKGEDRWLFGLDGTFEKETKSENHD